MPMADANLKHSDEDRIIFFLKQYTVWRYTAVQRPWFGSRYGRLGNGTTVCIRFHLKEIFCFNWHRNHFVYKSAGSKQLCTTKVVTYLGVSGIQNTNLGQLCSLYCYANILKVFKDHSTGYVIRSEEIRDFFQCIFIILRYLYTLNGQFIWTISKIHSSQSWNP